MAKGHSFEKFNAVKRKAQLTAFYAAGEGVRAHRRIFPPHEGARRQGVDGKHRSHRLREASPGPAGLFPRRVTDSIREHTSAMPATIVIEGCFTGEQARRRRGSRS